MRKNIFIAETFELDPFFIEINAVGKDRLETHFDCANFVSSYGDDVQLCPSGNYPDKVSSVVFCSDQYVPHWWLMVLK